MTGTGPFFFSLDKGLVNNPMEMFLVIIHPSFEISHFQVADVVRFCIVESPTKIAGMIQ